MLKLQRGCQELNLILTPTQLEQFEQYYQDLVKWNAKFNLTAIIDYEEVQIKHFLDSLVSLPVIAEELEMPLTLAPTLRMVDVGTGAGFPGLPLKIVAPNLKLTLMDGTGKKISYLKQLVQKLSLADVDIIQGRAEELGRQPTYRGRFDLVVARAVAPLNTLLEYLVPLIKLEGYAVIYKGANLPQEFMEARRAIDLLGCEAVRFAPVQVPFLDQKRFILLIKKVKDTPKLYPRGQGLARKQPLK